MLTLLVVIAAGFFGSIFGAVVLAGLRYVIKAAVRRYIAWRSVPFNLHGTVTGRFHAFEPTSRGENPTPAMLRPAPDGDVSWPPVKSFTPKGVIIMDDSLLEFDYAALEKRLMDHMHLKWDAAGNVTIDDTPRS